MGTMNTIKDTMSSILPRLRGVVEEYRRKNQEEASFSRAPRVHNREDPNFMVEERGRRQEEAGFGRASRHSRTKNSKVSMNDEHYENSRHRRQHTPRRRTSLRDLRKELKLCRAEHHREELDRVLKELDQDEAERHQEERERIVQREDARKEGARMASERATKEAEEKAAERRRVRLAKENAEAIEKARSEKAKVLKLEAARKAQQQMRVPSARRRRGLPVNKEQVPIDSEPVARALPSPLSEGNLKAQPKRFIDGGVTSTLNRGIGDMTRTYLEGMEPMDERLSRRVEGNEQRKGKSSIKKLL